MMDLPYFLEMVDLKHRYGSNLRAYHAEWKKSDTHENFFQWLDHGEGKEVEIPQCSRARLEKEQVRYLSREERLQYLVDVDEDGRLRWHKNGERLDTTVEYRDSVEGIVPVNSKVKMFRQDELEALKSKEDALHQATAGNETSSTDSISHNTSDSDEPSRRYPDPIGLQKAKGPAKIVHVTPATILNRLLRTSVKKNTWIFTADTNMNLYVGIKQSGAFQHSSFLHGTRISAAGLIKIKNGQLRSLSPLSGHYRPPAASFRHFITSLKERHVDMSRVSISKSYAVLVGLEAYLGSKQQVKAVGEGVKHGVERVLHPEQARERKEKEKDTSQSARLEEAKLREMQENRGIGKVLKEVRNKVRGEEAERAIGTGQNRYSSMGSRTRKSLPPNATNTDEGAELITRERVQTPTKTNEPNSLEGSHLPKDQLAGLPLGTHPAKSSPSALASSDEPERTATERMVDGTIDQRSSALQKEQESNSGEVQGFTSTKTNDKIASIASH